MALNNKIGIVVVRIGKFDDYIDYWAKSASANSTCDFLIFTDDSSFISKYTSVSNFKIFPITKKEIEHRLSMVVGHQVTFKEAYKLCDFKPSYGLIFKPELQQYDYWGFCDTDLIFGDISSFVSKRLNRFDRLYNLGHFNLFKNTCEINSLFLTINHAVRHLTFEMALKEEINIYFDEYFGLNKIWDNQIEYSQYKNPKDYADIDIYNYRLRRTDDHLPYYYEFNNGKLFEKTENTSREILYVHLQKRKMLFNNEKPGNIFYITNNMFIDNETKAKELFRKKYIIKNAFYEIKQKIKYYTNRYKRKKYIKKSVKTDFHKICY